MHDRAGPILAPSYMCGWTSLIGEHKAIGGAISNRSVSAFSKSQRFWDARCLFRPGKSNTDMCCVGAFYVRKRRLSCVKPCASRHCHTKVFGKSGEFADPNLQNLFTMGL